MVDLSSLTRPQLRVLSAMAADFAVVWLAALFTARDIKTLLTNAVFAIVSVYLALNAEKVIEIHDRS